MIIIHDHHHDLIPGPYPADELGAPLCALPTQHVIHAHGMPTQASQSAVPRGRARVLWPECVDEFLEAEVGLLAVGLRAQVTVQVVELDIQKHSPRDQEMVDQVRKGRKGRTYISS